MRYLLRLDLERIRRNLSDTATQQVTDDDVFRALAERGVWRHNDDWWGASEAAVGRFGDGEVLQKQPGV